MEFETSDTRPGLSIFDPIENARFELYTPTPIDPKPDSTDGFHFPVESAVGFEATIVEVPKLVSTVVRRQSGELVADATTSDQQAFETGSYLIELQSTPMKLYLAFEGGFTLRPTDTSVRVDFDAPCYVRVGARSFHEQPVGTITVGDDVRDEMTAISYFGSALKTTLCERSFPTLRGHPPLIEHGDALAVPEALEQPDIGVELVVPPDREYVYPLVSLAFYLGAEVVTGTDPRLVAGDFEYSLDRTGGYEATVNRTLQQIFFLDCLTRTEGYYPVELHERTQVEPLVDLDFADLYGRPIPEQLPAYLSVEFETLEPHMLDWHLTTDILPDSQNVPALPYFADELSLWRIPPDPDRQSTEQPAEAFDEFTRSAVSAGALTRSTSDDRDTDGEMFQVESVDTLEHAWVGDGYPIDANKVTLDSLRRRTDRTPTGDSTLDVRVVCNDQQMAEENVVSELYGLRDLVDYEVTIHEETTTAELADLFESSADFLHYIGHVDDMGFRCTDGFLDADSLDTVGVEAFLLNACQSYEQGATLVEKGSRGGVVTVHTVVNVTAKDIGRALARLLNAGFSLRSALAIAKDTLRGSGDYITIGDGGLTLCQSEGGHSVLHRIESENSDYIIETHYFPTLTHKIGSFTPSFLDKVAEYHLIPGSLSGIKLTAEELDMVLETELLPVEFEDYLYWSDELSFTY